MALSKPIYDFLTFYFEQLFTHPLRTKSITSCVLATSANVVSQKMMGNKTINHESMFAYGLFGLLFGGSLPHYFYKIMETTLAEKTKLKQLLFLAAERLLYTPTFQAISLYSLAVFEGKTHDEAVQNLGTLYWPVLKANWTYLSLLIFINIKFVPPMLRVLVGNLIGFGWVIFLASKRRRLQIKMENEKEKRNKQERRHGQGQGPSQRSENEKSN